MRCCSTSTASCSTARERSSAASTTRSRRSARRALWGGPRAGRGPLGGRRPPPADLRRFVGPPLADGFAELVGPQRAGELVTAYRTRYATARLGTTPVYPGILEVL